MRNLFGTIYWIVVGVLTIVGIYVSVLGNLPPYFLLIALAMTVIGAWRPGLRCTWAALIAFGFLPALFLFSSLMGKVIEADWSCCEISFQPGEIFGYGGGPSEEEVVCATIPGQLIVASAVFWAITIAGIAILLYLLRRAHLHINDQGTRLGTVLGTIGLSMVLFMVVSRYLR